MIYQRGERYWVQYWKDGARFRESVLKATGENTPKAARDLERKRLGELEAGTWVGPDERRVRLADLRTLLDADYVDKDRKSADRVSRAWKHLEAFFPGNPRALHLTTQSAYTVSGAGEAQGTPLEMAGAGRSTSDRYVSATGVFLGGTESDSAEINVNVVSMGMSIPVRRSQRATITRLP